MQIILDLGSGNSCKNDIKIVKKMIDEIARVDKHKHEVILKWQLFEKAGENIPLEHEVFEWAYEYAKKKGYKTTASVFSEDTLAYLMGGRGGRISDKYFAEYKGFEVPFVKIPNRRDLYHLVEKIPRTMPVYISFDNQVYLPKCLGENDKKLYCISKYPATRQDYFTNVPCDGFSDHTIGTKLINDFKDWAIIEKHFRLPDSTGLDAGPFAITPNELKEVLG